ncbi:hypothetical protein QFZ24_001014 [Streptomyces phaeochromogenes]|nr:hypothetical protein [Streptomyces phaeochromogenes]
MRLRTPAEDSKSHQRFRLGFRSAEVGLVPG